MSPITILDRDQQGRQLYAVLRDAGYLAEEPESDRFIKRLSMSLARYGAMLLFIPDDATVPDELGGDTALLGGDR